MILFETTKSQFVIKGEIKIKTGCKRFDFLSRSEREGVDYQTITFFAILIFV